MKKQKSLRQLAGELNVSPSYLSMILSGQRNPNTKLRDKLCSLGMLTIETGKCLESRRSTPELIPQK
jgi:transcriptional regulator with XRE-family HTH domain